MQPFLEMLEQQDRLWKQAEDRIAQWLAPFPATAPAGSEPSGNEASDPPETLSLKDLGVAILGLKRIQDARRTIRQDAAQWEAATPDGKTLDEMDSEKISRIIRRIEQNGHSGDAPEDDAEPV